MYQLKNVFTSLSIIFINSQLRFQTFLKVSQDILLREKYAKYIKL